MSDSALPSPARAHEAVPALRTLGLRFQYPDGVTALDGVDLCLGRGEKVALLGPNGAGKSTLLLHLNGILRGEGQIEVLGELLTDNSLRRIRAHVGLLFSNPDDQLFSPTVLDDVAYGPLYMGLPRDEVLARAHRALAQVGMANLADRAPHHLSLGQKKRVALATVLSMDAQVLALDEPTANLSPGARRDLVTLLRGLPLTMVIATHDLGLAEALCERAVVMDAGRIVADGPTPEILADTELLAAHDLEPLGHPAATRHLLP